jgi:hypothetical protein
VEATTARYEIRIRGELSADLSTELGPLTVDTRRAETVLHGEIADQAALHGVLDLLQEQGLQLVEVRRLPDDPWSGVSAASGGPSGSSTP